MQSINKAVSHNAGYLMLIGCVLSLLGHVALLQRSKLDWMSSSISELSVHGHPYAHGFVLLSFASSQALVASRVNYSGAGLLTRCIQALSFLNALLLASLGYVFTIADPTLHTILLGIIASNTGIMMSLLLAIRNSNKRAPTRIILNGVLLVIWLVLIPAFLLAGADFAGVYQRTVGLVYLAWLVVIALTPDRLTSNRQALGPEA